MLSIKRRHYFEFFFSIIGLMLFTGLIYFIVDYQGDNKKNKEMKKEITNAYHAGIEENKKAALLLFELQFNQSDIILLLQEATDTQDIEALTLIKQRLYRALDANFQRSRQYFPQQKIYLQNGLPFVNLVFPHHPFPEEYFYSEGLQKVIKTNALNNGLALQDGVYLYRFYFPIFDDQHVLMAVAEVALPLENIQHFLFAKYGVVSDYLFVKRKLLDIRYKRKLYQEATLSSSYYVLKQEGKGKKNSMSLSTQEYSHLKETFNKHQEEALLKLDPFSLQEELKGQDRFIHFLPLRNISGDEVGYLFTYTTKTNLTYQNNNRLLLLCLAMVLFFMVCYYFYRVRESYKNSIGFYINTIDALPFPVFCKDDKNNYQCANSAFFKHFNLDRKVMFSEGDKAFQNEPEMLQISSTELAELGGRKSIKEQVIDEVGVKNVATSLFLIEKKNKMIEGILGYIVDETTVLVAQAKLQDALKLQEQLMNSLSVGVRIFGADKKVKLVNKAFEKLSGYKKHQLMSSACEQFFTCLQCSPEVCPLKKSETEYLATHVETIKYTQGGETRTLCIDFNPLYDDKGLLSGIIEISTDVTQSKTLQDKTHELNTCDELTGLLNLRGLMGSGENYFRLAQRTQKPFFAVHFDIHGIRKLNDKFGESAVDQLLKDFAFILMETFRDTDLVARIGGDEFVVLLNDSDYKVADSGHFVRLELNVQKYNLQPENQLKLLIDTGIVQYSSKNHKSLDMLLGQCEKLVFEQQLKRDTK